MKGFYFMSNLMDNEFIENSINPEIQELIENYLKEINNEIKRVVLSRSAKSIANDYMKKRTTEIDVLSGLEGGQQVEDVQYFKDKLISGLGVPKSYLGYDETIGRSNLGMQDQRFAKSVLRLQNALRFGIKQICDVHLAARNIDPSQLEYQISMTTPSGALETAHIESQKNKCDLASQYQGLNIPDEYIWKNILGMTDEDIAIIQGKATDEIPPSDGKGQSAPPLETPPEDQQSPASPKPEQQTASKYRKIDKSKQLNENVHIQLLKELSMNQNNLSNRIQGVRGLVQEVRNSIRKK